MGPGAAAHPAVHGAERSRPPSCARGGGQRGRQGRRGWAGLRGLCALAARPAPCNASLTPQMGTMSTFYRPSCTEKPAIPSARSALHTCTFYRPSCIEKPAIPSARSAQHTCTHAHAHTHTHTHSSSPRHKPTGLHPPSVIEGPSSAPPRATRPARPLSPRCAAPTFSSREGPLDLTLRLWCSWWSCMPGEAGPEGHPLSSWISPFVCAWGRGQKERGSSAGFFNRRHEQTEARMHLQPTGTHRP